MVFQEQKFASHLHAGDLKRAEQEAAAVVGGAAAKAAPNNLANRTKISMEALKKEKLYANFKVRSLV